MLLITLPLCLPFLTEIDSCSEEKAASSDKALACAVIEVEKERKKEKDFLIFHQEGERILSLLKVLWPFTIIETSSKQMILFDSLSLLKKVFDDGSIDFCYEFNESINGCVPSLKNRNELFGWLEKNTGYFRDFRSIKQVEINGCFKEKKSLQEILFSMSLLENQDISAAIALSVVIDSEKAKTTLTEMVDLKKKTQKDMDTLQETYCLTESFENKWTIEFLEKIKQARRYWNNKIEESRPEVEARILEFESQREEELGCLRPEIEKLENQVNQWEAQETREQASVNYAERNLNQAKEELNSENDLFHDDERDISYISVLESRVNDAQKELNARISIHNETAQQVSLARELLNERKEECNSIKKKYNSQINDEQMRITVLKNHKEEETAKLEKDLSRATESIKELGKDLANLVQQKRAILAEIESVSFPLGNFPLQLLKDPYIYVPLYIAKLENSTGSRFVVIPPSKLKMSKSNSEKIGNFFLRREPSISEPRKPVFRDLAVLLQSVLTINNSVSRDILENTKKVNLLSFEDSKKIIKNGMQLMANEALLSEKSVQKLLLTLGIAKEQNSNPYQQTISAQVRFICPKCGTNVCLDIDHCPSCGTPKI